MEEDEIHVRISRLISWFITVSIEKAQCTPLAFLKIAHSILSNKAMPSTYDATDTRCGITLRKPGICMVNRMQLGIAQIWLSVN
jgi:hypothetical protein